MGFLWLKNVRVAWDTMFHKKATQKSSKIPISPTKLSKHLISSQILYIWGDEGQKRHTSLKFAKFLSWWTSFVHDVMKLVNQYVDSQTLKVALNWSFDSWYSTKITSVSRGLCPRHLIASPTLSLGSLASSSAKSSKISYKIYGEERS